MWASPESGEAGFIDAGTIEVMSGASPLARVMDMEVDGQQAPTGIAMDAMIEQAPGTSVQLELTWQGGVDIEFEPDTPGTEEPDGIRLSNPSCSGMMWPSSRRMGPSTAAL